MAAAPPGDITGFACEVLDDWDPRALNVSLPPGLSPPLKVRKGEPVFVFKTVTHPTMSVGYTHRAMRATHQRGWVPLTILKQGEPVAPLPLPIELPAATQIFTQNANNAGQEQPANVLQDTLQDFWRSIKASEADLKNVIPGISDQSGRVLFHPRVHEYGDFIYNNMVPQARAIMGSGQFNLEALRTLRPVSLEWPNQAGIYIIIYEDFEFGTIGRTAFRIALYVGQTIAFHSRMSRHQDDADSSSSPHYRVARKAGTMRMLPIILSPGGNIPDNFLDIAEFTMVCLFQSWHPALFRPSETNVVGAYSTDFDACVAFSSLMRDVSIRTGWIRGRLAYGLNWNTPIIANVGADMQWTSWYLEAKDTYVYRTQRNVRFGHSETVDLYWQAERRISIPIALAREAEFQHHQSVHLVVEIKKRNGNYLTHPFRFVRYPPQIGLNPELEKLRSMAVRIEWVDKHGNWKSYYLERQRIWTPKGSSNIPEIFCQALFMMCNVEQIIYNNPPAWTLPTAPARINYLRYVHLQQKMVVEVRPVQYRMWPADNTIARNTQRLQQLFPAGPDANTVIGQRPPAGFLPYRRASCDLCFSQETSTPCQYNPETRTCQNCRCLNRPCTFSRSDGNGRLIDDFNYGKRLEELGVAPHMARSGSMASDMAEAPFDPDLEAQEHAQPAAN